MSGARLDIALLVLSAGLLGAVAWGLSRPVPSLDGIEEQVAAGDLKGAEFRARSVLRHRPGETTARLWLADLAVERAEAPDPQEALRLVAETHPTTPRQAAFARLIEGKARFRLKQLDAAETAWRDAIRLDPSRAPAAWALLHLYALQGRPDDARKLVLGVVGGIRDRRETARLLLHLLRPDAHPVSPQLVESELAPCLRQAPDDVETLRAVARARIDLQRADEGLALLRDAVQRQPNHVSVWAAYLECLDAAGDPAALVEAWEQVPPGLQDAPEMREARARVALLQGDRAAALRDYETLLERHPDRVPLAYRLSRILVAEGRTEEGARLQGQVRTQREAQQSIRPLYDQAFENPSFPTRPLVRGLAELLDALRRFDEAAAWRRLIGEAAPP